MSRKSVVYFPPIGMKLMKKYVGSDMKRLPRFFSSTLPKISTLNLESHSTTSIVSEQKSPCIEKTELLAVSAHQFQVVSSENFADIAAESTPLPQILVTEPTSEMGNEHSHDDLNEVNTDEENDADEAVFESDINSYLSVMKRRSSRSTFRTPNTVRFYSQPSILEEHNLNVIAMPTAQKGKSKSTSDIETERDAPDEKTVETPTTSKRFKGNKLSSDSQTKLRKFCLDYGDGKLHDTLKIPKVKDCSRPWCNPFCKTCQMRSTSRPCFVLIPYEGNEPPRKIADKRRPSMFPVYRTGKPSRIDSDDDSENENGDAVDVITPTGAVDSKAIAKVENANKQMRNSLRSFTSEADRDSAIALDSIVEDPASEKFEQTVEIKKKIEPLPGFKLKKGYSMKRMEELSQPRWGHPAEVRFSKASLRRRKEEMKETERTKELSWREQQNLTYIQGKISHFLAVLNEKEAMLKPTRLPDIPIREVIDSHKLIHEAKKRKKLKRLGPKHRREFV